MSQQSTLGGDQGSEDAARLCLIHQKRYLRRLVRQRLIDIRIQEVEYTR